MSEELTLEKRIELVKAAIEKAHAAQEYYRLLGLDATAKSIDLWRAKQWLKSAESEFAWQCGNVKAIFEAKGI